MDTFWTSHHDGHGPPLEIGKLRREGSWHAVEVCLHAGTRYKPGISPQMCQIIIIEGRGFVDVEDQAILYTPGSVITVPKGAMHCFSFVKNKTIFTKRWQSTDNQAAEVQKLLELIGKYLTS